jgi:hypothetical protein
MSYGDKAVAMTSTQTVVVHHWHPDMGAPLEWYCGSPAELLDTPMPRPHECSIPLTITVVEMVSGSFKLRGIPDHCPLCQRALGSLDKRRIHNIAIQQHLDTTSFLDHSVIRKTADVVLDV